MAPNYGLAVGNEMSSEETGQPSVPAASGNAGAAGGSGGAAGGSGGQQPGGSGAGGAAGGGGAGAVGGGGTGAAGGGGGGGSQQIQSSSALAAGNSGKSSTGSSKGPASRTRQKGKAGSDKGKRPMKPGAFESYVDATLQEGDQMIKIGTDRLNEERPDPAGLQADADAIQHVADQVAGLDFSGALPALEEKAQEAVALLAGLQLVHQLLSAKMNRTPSQSTTGAGPPAPPPLFPPATPVAGGGGGGPTGGGSRSNSRRNSVSSTGGGGGGRGGRRRNSVSAGGGASVGTGGNTVVQRLQQMAAGAGSSGAGNGRWGSLGGRSTGANRSLARTGSGFGVGGRRNPFDSDSCKLDDGFYFDLPFPWNALPRREITSAVEVFKVAAVSLPKFNGTHSGYSSWRNCFIPCVHLTDIDVSHKCLMLRSSMEVKTARMREFVDGIVSNEDGYREAILKLEDRYGGDEALLLARQEALLAVPELREGECRIVELLHSRLNTFLVEWAGVNGTEMDETESLAFYTLVMSKVEPTYTLRYLDWLRLNGLQKGLHSLHDWLAQQLKDHRAVELYHRRRTISLRSGARQEGGGHQQQARRNSVPPPGHLDRNFRPQGRAFMTLDEEWEGLEEDAGSYEGGEVFDDGPHLLARLEARKPLKCPICVAVHPLGSCPKFQAMKPRQRKDFLIQEGRCFLCFQNTHPVTKCRFRYNCARCGGKHHTMIHGADENAAGGSHFLSNEGELDLEGAAEVVNFGLLAGENGQRKTVSLRTITLRVRNPENGKSCN